MPEKEPAYRAHQEWLGHVQPVGLVVSPPALLAAQAIVNRNIAPVHGRFLEWLEEAPPSGEPRPRRIRDLAGLVQDVFGWRPGDLAGLADGAPVPGSLEVVLTDYGETLRPTYAVRDPEPHGEDASPWLLLIQEVPPGADLDAVTETDEHRWHASPHARFERLLRETRVATGLLSSGTHLRLVHAPRGETSGHLTFPVQAMAEPSGRPMFAGLHMLLEADRLFTLPRKQRLPHILAESRRYQSEVSTRLSEQVLNALHELLRGFQAADDRAKGLLLHETLAAKEDPNPVYAGLLTTLLRLVFILYAEERGLLPAHEVYARSYSVGGLFERLRADADRHPDTMDARYGAWAQLLSLFRLIHDGARHDKLHLPPRHGDLFDPDRYPFLEGRRFRSARNLGERIAPPLVPDGVVYRVLQDLLLVDGERIAYRALDVEQIGSVYQAIMGFKLKVAAAPTIAVKPRKAHGAPEIVDLEALLKTSPAERAKTLARTVGLQLTGKAAEALRSAATVEAIVAAIGSRVAATTPSIVPAGAMVLEPSDERRRSGSHYTPRSLTGPIVQTTLEPVLRDLGPHPTPEQVLALKVCDPAMGSGAFLVEVCRQIGEALVAAWHRHGRMPTIPPDEDELLHARRLVAQHCLYGVDKNPLAVDLAKLSLWLTTLARDHAFTFVDHALRAGDSLVGLTRAQIAAFHWEPKRQYESVGKLVEERLAKVKTLREQIQASTDDESDEDERRLYLEAEAEIADVRLVGDLAVSAFFAASKAKDRETRRAELAARVQEWLQTRAGDAELRGVVEDLHEGERAIRPFHWEIEFPEVFARENPGFDAFVGNPPFAGKNTILENAPEGYLDWLKAIHEDSHGNADLVAHFFRRAFASLRSNGTLGLIATKTIRQGDTRATGLRWICSHGGTVFAARRRYKWVGEAAVVVSIVHVRRGPSAAPRLLDGRAVDDITAFLFHAGGSQDPEQLKANAGKSFIGSYVLGMGFTFDDTDRKGVASPISEMKRLIEKEPRNAERIFPYIGGEEVNDSPTHAHHRYVINFGDMTEEDGRRWPDLMRIVEERVKPERLLLGDNADARRRRENWWLWGRYTPALFAAIHGLDRVLAVPRTSMYTAFVWLPARQVFSENLVVLTLRSNAAFAVLQGHVHELWVRLTSSTLEDRQGYRPSDCFETFPFPEEFESNPALEQVGREYYEYRAALMVKNDEGLTKTYNRFHDPDESDPAIVRFRELHDAMDRAVLDAYGWQDVKPTCEFLLDYEDDEEADDDGAPKSNRKKPWRYRWPDDVHDEVLARLLDLNRKRAEAERLSGVASEPKSKKRTVRPRRSETATKHLFEES